MKHHLSIIQPTTTMSKKKNAPLMSLGDRERLRVAATVTQETDWPQSEPNQGLARMFVIMLLVHIVVIGGVIIYDFIGEPADSKPMTATSKPKPAASTAPTNAVASEVAPLPVVKEAPPAPAPTMPVATAVTTVPVDSLLPADASTTTLDTAAVIAAVPAPTNVAGSPAEPLYSAPIGQPAALPAPAKIVSVPLTEAEPEPTTVAKVESSPPPAPAKIITQTAPVKSDPPAKPKVKESAPAEAPARRAVALGTQPKPVLTPSAARKALDNDNKRSATPTPTTRKKAVADAPPASKKPASKSTSGRYTVAKGDTIYKIARRYKVSEDAVMKANGIKNAASLQIGKNLVIPAK